jgi:hypothetical protein
MKQRGQCAVYWYAVVSVFGREVNISTNCWPVIPAVIILMRIPVSAPWAECGA